jgi:hypothetical protein
MANDKQDMCSYCQKTFDEVHPMDWFNDMRCRDIGMGCVGAHTWREHVAESWHGRWINPHFRVRAQA